MNTIIEQAPQEWKTVNFKEIAKERSSRVDNPRESGYEIYVGLEHLDSGSLIVKRHGSTKDVTSSMKLFKKGDILFARRNTYLRRCSVATFDGVCSGDIIVLQPILNHIVEGFLSIFMQFEPLENRIISLSAGAFSKRIKWRQLAEEKIPIPSKEEQQKIVETVWSMQENIQKTEKLIKTTEKLKKGLLNELLTKGIGHTLFKDTELGRIPEEWEVKKIKDLFTVCTGTTPSTIIEEFWTNGHINWYTPLDLGKLGKKKILDQSNKMVTQKGVEKNNLSILPKDSIIISTRAPVGYVGVIPEGATFNQGCKGLIKRDNSANYIFYYFYLLNSKERLESFSGGSTFKELTKKSLENFTVVFPPYEEQIKISDIIDFIDNSILKLIDHKDFLNNLKKKLTNELLSGEIII